MTKLTDIDERYRMVVDPECPTVVAKLGARRDWQDLSGAPRAADTAWWERAHCFECEQCMRYSRASGLLWSRVQPVPPLE